MVTYRNRQTQNVTALEVSQLSRKVDVGEGLVLPDIADIGDRLKWVREAVLKLSPERLSDEMGVSDTTVRRVEAGIRHADAPYLIWLAKKTGIPGDWLLLNGHGDAHTQFLVKQLQERLAELMQQAGGGGATKLR